MNSRMKFPRTKTRSARRRIANRRRGSLLFAVLACIAVVTVLIFSALTSSLSQRRHLRRALQLEQTQWLLEGAAQQVRAGKLELGQKLESFTLTKANGDELTCSITLKKADSADRLIVTATIGDAENPLKQTQRSTEVNLP